MDHDQFREYLRPADEWRQRARRMIAMSREHQQQPVDPRQRERSYSSGQGDFDSDMHEWNHEYDDQNTGKYENYSGDGYYGSNYGSPNQLNRGRDYEHNAGYRDNYNRLPVEPWTGQEEIDRRRSPAGTQRGKGPRNYNRPDMRIFEDVSESLAEDPYIDAREVEVHVENGEVVLTGIVNDKNMKRRVDDVLQDIKGLRQVENRLRTRLPGGQIVGIRNR